ncbi:MULTISPECIES: TylF/MycF/NovP-related O-methyltransferase [Paraburkholderia]|uniref:TylF/MycF/NovP-related O-methyltransferase n=1 Tax=Paraburkholderia TaxID=1822464 RepID=UPI00225BEFE0|nr:MULTISPECIES: TylF/MycF/NovP-related O-methyltransferase [Paraburkholderia]MCX4159954.1 class I SAM-dependent methyltransferase [Paraburkholderia megapolitana]MDN7155454.1 class I SAM-dependent methyltransferase [Paraburkholderia sp. CHISQ3]MDQ6492498.1 class I SAM-dependent methyltransferase [Paraburkholderia megapolitana]
MTNLHLAGISLLRNQTHGPDLEHALRQLHVNTSNSVVAGRNVTAGYVRSWGLQSPEGIAPAIAQDPIYKESMELARGWTVVDEHKLMNLFLILKYGLAGIEGDIVEFGSYKGGSAIFMANIARRLETKAKVYALDTFEGMPETDTARDLHMAGDFKDSSLDALRTFAQENQLVNLIPVQGLFEQTAPALLEKIDAVTLAHIDCDIYSAVKFATEVVRPKMHASGGYLAFDDPLQATCLGALEAVEGMIQATGLHAEQAYPHLVYRFPAPAISAAGESSEEAVNTTPLKETPFANALARIDTLETALRDKEERLHAIDEQLSALNGQLHEKDEQLRARNGRIDELQGSVLALHASTSWRLTAPLRALKAVFTGGR